MDAYLVFNELSATAVAPDQLTGIRHLDGLADVLLDPRISGRKILVTLPEFLQMQVSRGYSVGRWVAQYSQRDREWRLRLRTLVDHRIDYVDCVAEQELDASDVEFKYLNTAALGLSVAFLAGGLAVSLLSADDWNVAKVRIERSWIEGDDVSTVALDVPHAGRCDHLGDNAEWLLRTQATPPKNGMQLWEQRDSLFPSLDFCESAEEQIKSLNGGGPGFRPAARGLQDLQNYCSSWTAGGFDIHALNNASGESKSTIEQYSAERTFRCPDGVRRLFEWHLKRGDTRIHFRELPEQNRILVGYVGGHLKISTG
jgi:hypothetical protein